MAVRGRAAAAAAMAAVDRRLPSLDDFAGQSWSAWVERAGPPAEPGSEVEESGKNRSKKLDAMTLIKEDMSIFGHCPAHDEFYLVVCNHCSQVVKPQAFQKHCERRHGPLSKLYARAQASANAQKCHAINGQPPSCGAHGSAKASREKSQSSRSRAQHPPDRPDKAQKDNLCLFMPVVNLEKISSLPKPDGHGIKVPPKAAAASVPGQPSASSRESLGKLSLAVSPKEPLMPAKAGVDSVEPADGPGRKPESIPALGEKEPGATKLPPKSHKKMARKECDLNRQCGVVNPDTKKICTRLLTCKIHSVHQRREVPGRAKDFDVLVAELKASSRKGESPKEKSPVRKDALPDRLSQEASVAQTSLVLPSTSPCRAKPPHPHCALPRSRLSSESDPEEPSTACGDRDPGLYPFPVPKGSSRVSSDESEDDATEESHRLDCHYATRPPRPQAFCTFGSRLVSPGCYVFNRRLDRFCSALSSMLERHLSSHMWKKIPPAAEPQLHPAPSPAGPAFSTSSTSQTGGASLACSLPHGAPGRTSLSCTATAARESRGHPSLSYAVGSPHAAAACSQSDCTGGSQSITSPLPANTPSPSFSKLPSTKASKSAKAKELAGSSAELEASARKRKQPLGSAAGPPYKRTCLLDPGKGKGASCQVPRPPAKTKPSLGSPSAASLNGAVPPGSRVKRAGHLDCRAPGHPQVKASQLENRGSPLNGPKALQANCVSDEEAKKRKNAAACCRPVKPKHPAPASDAGCAVRRKKAVASLSFEEKRNALKPKAH